MAPVAGKAFLIRVMDRVWEANQHNRYQEYQTGAIVLRLLGLCLEHCGGVTSHPFSELPPITLDVACSRAFGVPFERWTVLVRQSTERMEAELAMCVPDYDYSEDRRKKIAHSDHAKGNSANSALSYLAEGRMIRED